MSHRPPDPPGYVAPYRKRHRPLTVTLTNEEHEEIAGQAEILGLSATAYATLLLCADCIDEETFEEERKV